MIFKDIKRRCGHEEQIGIAGFSGELHNIPTKFQHEVMDNIKSAESKLCLPCLKALSKEAQREEMDSHT